MPSATVIPVVYSWKSSTVVGVVLLSSSAFTEHELQATTDCVCGQSPKSLTDSSFIISCTVRCQVGFMSESVSYIVTDCYLCILYVINTVIFITLSLE